MKVINPEDIKTIKTTRGKLRFYRDWDNYEGGVVMLNAQTIDRYKAIQDEHPDADKCGVLFAFSKEQFNKGYRHLVELGHIKDGDKIMQDKDSGAFGTDKGLKEFFNFYDNSRAAIPKECDPQEVYFYEYNNHECMFSWEGDEDAINIVLRYWGEEVAKNIFRL